MIRHVITLEPGVDLDGFRKAARWLTATEVTPAEVLWSAEGAPLLIAGEAAGAAPPLTLPRPVTALIESVVCHRDPERYGLLYTLIHRITKGDRDLLARHNDPLVHRLDRMARSVRRDIHKMHAFVRFRCIETAAGEERFIAWFEPEHHILDAVAPFFVERFRSLHWAILTPRGSLHWNGEQLDRGPPAAACDAPDEDALEPVWRSYYESVFNAARVNPKAMRAEMPKRYWRNMPEARAIPALIRSAGSCLDEMLEKPPAIPLKRDPIRAVAAMARQEPRTLSELNAIISASEPLVEGGSRAVLGEGPLGAAIAFVGEQPGDHEDLRGRPFVGPAGQLLDRAMSEAGIDRKASYLTNAVKHFKFEPRGKRRIHRKPTTSEVKHYRWWLIRELELVRPKLVVALGATAALALNGEAMGVKANRGQARFGNHAGYLTVHPSHLLRIADPGARQEAYRLFLDDLHAIRRLEGTGPALRAVQGR